MLFDFLASLNGINSMISKYLIFILVFLPTVLVSQTLIFAELTGSPNVNTTGWNLTGATYSGDTGGDANAFSDEIILTDAIGSSSGGIFYNQSIDLSTCFQWKVEFDFRMWEGSAADGIAFCFLDVPPTGFVSGGGVGIPAASNGVFVILDTYDNGCGANPEIQIYQGAGYDECGPGMINRAEGLNFLRSSNYQTCLIEYNSGTLTISVNGTQYLTGNYNANLIGYMGFTASTGGSNDKHSIKNVRIYADIAEANAGPDVTICSGETAQLGVASNPNYTYNWIGDSNVSSSTISNPSVTLTNTTGNPVIYNFTLETTLANAPNSCPDNDAVTVTVNPVLSSSTSASICQGGTYLFSGQSFSAAGTYPVTLQSVYGCDSIATLNLTLNPLPNTILNEAICQGSTYSFNGQNIGVAGQYTQVLQTQAGCDSTIVLNLSINPVLSTTINETICAGETFTFFGQVLSTSGNYSQTLQTQSGCDSVVVLELTVTPLPDAPLIDSNSPVLCPGDVAELTANSSANAQYFWSGPLNFQSTDATITFPVQVENMGSYSVYVIVDGCQSSISSTPVSILNIYDFENFDFPNVITPNGDGLNDSLDINGYYKTCQEYNLLIYNRWGQVVYEQTISSPSFAGKSNTDLDLVDGIYFYTLTYGENRKNGFIHVIR
jgi:gliding motility-associated-like protein